MSSFPVRDPILLAYQWATLDQISGGRTVLVVCTGIGTLEGHTHENQVYGLERKDRVGRMIESVNAIKALWTEESASFEGRYFRFENVSIGPKPAQQPRPPIWIANSVRDPKLVERALRRALRHADGAQFSRLSPRDYAARWQQLRGYAQEMGRSLDSFGGSLYHNINVNEDRAAALEESKRFLELYYDIEFTPEIIDRWVVHGSPQAFIEKLREYRDAGLQEITLRITSWDQLGQLRRCIEEVLPFV
jgi:alkanesulfonate monooxygenase SsuD/methylene tetrahydromethanopterin reductase-like flavin-dependent oxidoreductase (luciferase family)